MDREEALSILVNLAEHMFNFWRRVWWVTGGNGNCSFWIEFVQVAKGFEVKNSQASFGLVCRVDAVNL